jgi:GxxExxY protein
MRWFGVQEAMRAAAMMIPMVRTCFQGKVSINNGSFACAFSFQLKRHGESLRALCAIFVPFVLKTNLTPTCMTENEIANKVIGTAIDVHRTLGPGLLENCYEQCLAYKIRKNGMDVEQQKAVPIVYEEVHLECGYRLDMVVNGKLVLEIKSVEALHDVHLAQTLTYMKFGGYKLGLLINFNVLRLKDGIRRVINGQLID